MTDLTKPRDPVDRLADVVGQLVDEVRQQNKHLDAATDAMSRHRRNGRLAIAAIVVAFAVAVVVAGQWATDRTAQDQAAERQRTEDSRAACERGNGIRSAVVVAVPIAAEVAVEETAAELAGADPTDRAQAEAVADRVSDRVTAAVAAIPALQPRDCTG